MAFKIQNNIDLKIIKIVSEQDDAIDWDKTTQETFEKYRKNADLNLLKFKPNMQPTVFICNFELKGKQAKQVKNSMLAGKDDDGKPSVSIGSWSYEVVKNVLKEIKNPDYLKPEEVIELVKDSQGFVSYDTLALLDRYGILSEIFSIYSNITSGTNRDQIKN
jgi:hypothetical protein